MRKKFSEVHPAIPIQEGTATSIPAPTASQDAVAVAQVRHSADRIRDSVAYSSDVACRNMETRWW
jgi:hypothetical protein